MFETSTELFAVNDLSAIELSATEAPLLQLFFERNSSYFERTCGQKPQPNDALEEMLSMPPKIWPRGKKWVLGMFNSERLIMATVNVIADLFAPSVWHIDLFIVDERFHGTGVAGDLYQALEDWMSDGGAEWIRLAVVVGNVRAERFWERRGFQQLRLREGVIIGAHEGLMRVMAKPLGDGSIADYCALVPRDRVQ